MHTNATYVCDRTYSYKATVPLPGADPRGLQGLAAPPQWKLALLRRRAHSAQGDENYGGKREIRAPEVKAQRRQFPCPFAEYLSPCLIFTQKVLYGCLPASKVALLIRKGALFAHDSALVRRYGIPPSSRDALLPRKSAFSPIITPSKLKRRPLH